MKVCIDCGKILKKWHAKQRCCRCYHVQHRRKKGIKPRPFSRLMPPCRICGNPKVEVRGLCQRCYRHVLYRAHRIFDRENTVKSEKRNAAIWQCGGNRELILKKYGYKCAYCDLTNNDHLNQFGHELHIHHIDGNGRSSKNPNHKPENLISLCKNCHSGIHGPDNFKRMLEAKQKKKQGGDFNGSKIIHRANS